MKKRTDYLKPGKMSDFSRIYCGSPNPNRSRKLTFRLTWNWNWSTSILILLIFKLVIVVPPGNCSSYEMQFDDHEDQNNDDDAEMRVGLNNKSSQLILAGENNNNNNNNQDDDVMERQEEKHVEPPVLPLVFNLESKDNGDEDADEDDEEEIEEDEGEEENEPGRSSRKLSLMHNNSPTFLLNQFLSSSFMDKGRLMTSSSKRSSTNSANIQRRNKRQVIRSTKGNSTGSSSFLLQLHFQFQFQWYATLLLAQQEAKCLQDFGGSQANSTLDDEYPDSLFSPFLCPTGESRESIQNGLQCEQCRNMTKKLMKTPEDCNEVCVGESWSCLSRCKNMTEELWSALEQFKSNCEQGHETSEDLDSCLLAQIQKNRKMVKLQRQLKLQTYPTTNTTENETDRNSTKPKFSIQHALRRIQKTERRREMALSMSMPIPMPLSLSSEPQPKPQPKPKSKTQSVSVSVSGLYQKIESIDVFCEGVIPLESSSGVSGVSGNSGNAENSIIINTENLESGNGNSNPNSRSSSNYNNRHFILLKTRIQTGASKRINETSGSETEEDEEEEAQEEQDSDSFTNDVNLPLIFVVEQRQIQGKRKQQRQSSMQLKQAENHQNPNLNLNRSIKEQQTEWTSWKTLGKTQYGFDKIPVDYHSNTYQWRVTVVNSLGIVDQMLTSEFKTLNGYVEPSPPTKIYVLSHRVVNDVLSVLIAWDKPPERPCFYKIVLENQDSEDKPRTIRIKDPLGVNRYWFENIQFGGNYGVRITSRSPSWKHEEESTHGRLYFIAPSCLEAYNYSFDKCAPPPPQNLKFTLITRKEKNGPDEIFSREGAGSAGSGAGKGNEVGSGESTKESTSMSLSSSGTSNVNSHSVSLHLKWSAPLYADLRQNQDKILKYVVNIVSVNLGLGNLQDSHLNSYGMDGKENLGINSRLTADVNFHQMELNLTTTLRNDQDYDHNPNSNHDKGNGNEKNDNPHLLLEEHVNPLQLSNSTKETKFLGPFILPSITRDMLIEGLLYNMSYSVSVVAISVSGSSPPATLNINTKLAAEMIANSDGIPSWVYYSIPCACILAITFSCHTIRSFIHKRKLKTARNLYFKSMEERDGVDHEWSIVPLNDDYSPWKVLDENLPRESWDVGYENLSFGMVIGEGAFGVVRRAKMPRKKYFELRNRYKELKSTSSYENGCHNNNNGKSTFYDNEDDCATETVAVKMLKGSTTKHDRDSLIKEIITMQNLGIHPQIVTLLGVCTVGRSLCLVLEHLPGGDLLTFLRSVRDKYWPMLNMGVDRKDRYFYKNGEIETRLSSNLKCDDFSSDMEERSRHSHSHSNSHSQSSQISYADVFVETQSPDSPEDAQSGQKGDQACEIEKENGEEVDDSHCRPIEERDVLSYARQISLGMAYLERNKIVHRDLACRNVLLMGDYRQVKISDFGLSRDVYTWNVYQQKSNGKLPIKWTAIESLFSHVFTSKSDVWSYGIVLWELITLGGNPYPGISDRELFRLLKSGYRMERPENCSYILYALMKKCWRASPGDRPSFAELRRHIEAMMEATEPGLYLSFQPEILSDYFDIDATASPTDLLEVPRRSFTNPSLDHDELDSPMSSTGVEGRFEGREKERLKAKTDSLPLKERRRRYRDKRNDDSHGSGNSCSLSTNGNSRNYFSNSSTCSSSSFLQQAQTYRPFGQPPSLHYVNECESPLDEDEDGDAEKLEIDEESSYSSTRKNSINSISILSSGDENKNKSENTNTNPNKNVNDTCSFSERRNNLHLYLKPINFKTVSHPKTKHKEEEEETDLSNLSTKSKDNNSNIKRKRLSKSLSPREHKNNTMDFFPKNKDRKPFSDCEGDESSDEMYLKSDFLSEPNCDYDYEKRSASTNTNKTNVMRRRMDEDQHGKKMAGKTRRTSSMSHSQWDSPSPGFLFPTSNHHVTSFIENRGYDL